MHTNYRLFVLTESDTLILILSAGQHQATRKPARGNGDPQHLVVAAAVCGPFLCPLVR